MHKEKLEPRKIRLIGLISFWMGFAQAFFIYVMSSFFKVSTHIENVGGFYLVAYAITLVCLLNFHKIVRRFGKANVFFWSLFLKIATIILLLMSGPSWTAAAFVILYIIFGNLEWVSLDIILESFSQDAYSGRIRGRHLTIINAGFLLAPFLSAWVLGKFDFYGIFLLLLIFNLLISLVAVFSLRGINHHFEKKLTVKEVAKKAFRRKDIRGIFYISFVLEFFYALMVIYTPIYLNDLGYSWEKIGLIFTFMLIPFVIFQYPAGVLADKKTGEKELLIFSLLLMGFSTIAIYFISSGTIIIWSVVLFITRIGASLIEILRDSYFFKRIDGYDVDLINLFRTSMPWAYILAAVLSALIIFFFSVKAVFILIGIVVLSALYPALRLKDNKSEKERG
jgi:MFS family permease